MCWHRPINVIPSQPEEILKAMFYESIQHDGRLVNGQRKQAKEENQKKITGLQPLRNYCLTVIHICIIFNGSQASVLKKLHFMASAKQMYI